MGSQGQETRRWGWRRQPFEGSLHTLRKELEENGRGLEFDEGPVVPKLLFVCKWCLWLDMDISMILDIYLILHWLVGSAQPRRFYPAWTLSRAISSLVKSCCIQGNSLLTSWGQRMPKWMRSMPQVFRPGMKSIASKGVPWECTWTSKRSLLLSLVLIKVMFFLVVISKPFRCWIPQVTETWLRFRS